MSWPNILVAIAIGLITAEILAWSERWAKWLIRHNARQAPGHLAERLEEEWLAHLESLPGKISKLLFAADCRRAAYAVSRKIQLDFHISTLSSVQVRAFDLVVAVAVWIVCLPLMLLIAVAIRLENAGSIFDVQERVGLHGRLFRMITFRTRRLDREDHEGRGAVAENDALTHVGRVICRLRMKYLPAVFNILSGQMGFVGPNAESPSSETQLRDKIPYYDLRRLLRPGLTGWAQIWDHGSAIEELQYDLYYIRHRSVLFNLQILFESLKKMFVQ